MTRHKLEAVKALGSKCAACGMIFNEQNSFLADIHHHVPNGNTARRFNSSTELGTLKTTEEFLKFLEGKVILCPMCHRRHHHDGNVNYTQLMPEVIETLGRAFFVPYKPKRV